MKSNTHGTVPDTDAGGFGEEMRDKHDPLDGDEEELEERDGISSSCILSVEGDEEGDEGKEKEMQIVIRTRSVTGEKYHVCSVRFHC